MKGFDRINVKSAVKSVKNFDLSQTHLTTANFGQPIPLYIKRIYPRDEFTVNAGLFTRMAPLVKPTYGRFSLRTMSVFVPSFQLCDDADAFYMNQKSWKGHTCHLVYMTYLEYVNYLISLATEVTLSSGQTANADGYIYDSNSNRVAKFDWCYTDANGSVKYVVFTNGASITKSRYPLTVLRALGYSIPTGVNLQTTSSWYTKFATKTINAMRMLAFFKAFNDWMSQSTRYNSSPTAFYLNEIRHDSTVTNYYDSTSHCITSTLLNALFQDVRLCFESDYFTSAWQKPNAPYLNNGNDTISQFTANNANASGQDFQILNDGVNVVPSISYTNNWALDWIESVAAYVRRNNYSGSREVEKVLSRWGIKSEDFKSNYVHLLDTDIIPVNVGDVTAQAQTNDSDPSKTVDLGDYAGKGIISGSNGFNFKSKDYGYLIVLGWYTINPMYSFGFDRDCFAVTPNDYYQPEFDGVGCEAISYGEVQTNPLALPSNQYKDDSVVFGFTERYNNDRYGRDVITGDFYDLHDDGDMNVWHLGRNVNSIRNAGVLVAQGPAFNTMTYDNKEFNRIFSVTDNSIDHFYLSAQFIVKARRPMLNLNQVPRLGEGDISIPRNGNEIN